MKQSTAEKEGSISIWGDKRGKREKITKNCTTKSSHLHFRHLQISKTEINVVIAFLAKIRRVRSSVLCKVEEVRIRNYNLEWWREKSPLTHTQAHTRSRVQAHIPQEFCFFAVTSVTLHVHKRFYDDENRHLLTPKTTRRSKKNNVSFSTKRRVTFNKTTCRFS